MLKNIKWIFFLCYAISGWKSQNIETWKETKTSVLTQNEAAGYWEKNYHSINSVPDIEETCIEWMSGWKANLLVGFEYHVYFWVKKQQFFRVYIFMMPEMIGFLHFQFTSFNLMSLLLEEPHSFPGNWPIYHFPSWVASYTCSSPALSVLPLLSCSPTERLKMSLPACFSIYTFVIILFSIWKMLLYLWIVLTLCNSYYQLKVMVSQNLHTGRWCWSTLFLHLLYCSLSIHRSTEPGSSTQKYVYPLSINMHLLVV